MANTKEFILGKIKATLQQVAPGAKLILFGSRARNEAREDSESRRPGAVSGSGRQCEAWPLDITASRLYYAAYYMASALLVDKSITARSHSGVIHIIGSEFVKKDLLTKEEGRLISRLFGMRQSGDYDDLFDWTEEVQPYFDKTKAFLKRMEDLITLK